MIAGGAEWLPVVIASILSGSFVGGIGVLIKVGRQKDRISVSAAEGALVVQEGVMKSLEDENIRLRRDKADCNRRNIQLVVRMRELQTLKGVEPDPLP